MIGLTEVEHVSSLARLALSEEEKKLFAEQLGKIIDHFDELKSVDTEGVEPMAHALSIVNVLREDEVKPPAGRDVLLEGGPDVEAGYFKVPKIGDN